MANSGSKGINVLQTGYGVITRATLFTSAGAMVTSGTTNLYLYELQDDGSLNSYDFNDNTFKTTALTTETQAMTHRKGNNNTTDTGVWTYFLPTSTSEGGLTVGAVYLMRINNTSAYPVNTYREFQYGAVEGDLSLAKSYPLNNFEFVMRASATPVLGVTFIPGVDNRSFINGFAAISYLGTPTEVGYGVYKVDLSALDLSQFDGYDFHNILLLFISSQNFASVDDTIIQLWL